MSRMALLLGSSLHAPLGFCCGAAALQSAEEGEIIKQVLATTQFSLLLQEPEGLTGNRVESGRCSKAGGTILEMGTSGPK